MPTPPFLLVYFGILATSIGNPREVAVLFTGVVLVKLLRDD